MIGSAFADICEQVKFCIKQSIPNICSALGCKSRNKKRPFEKIASLGRHFVDNILTDEKSRNTHSIFISTVRTKLFRVYLLPESEEFQTLVCLSQFVVVFKVAKSEHRTTTALGLAHAHTFQCGIGLNFIRFNSLTCDEVYDSSYQHTLSVFARVLL